MRAVRSFVPCVQSFVGEVLVFIGYFVSRLSLLFTVCGYVCLLRRSLSILVSWFWHLGNYLLLSLWSSAFAAYCREGVLPDHPQALEDQRTVAILVEFPRLILSS